MSNPTRDARIVQLANAGIPYSTIGQMFSITRARVQQIARAGGYSRDPSRVYDRITPRTEAEARNMMLLSLAKRVESKRMAIGFGKNNHEERERARIALAAWLRAQVTQ
jgi:hypothetical protein